jgi:hypothetical protein
MKLLKLTVGLGLSLIFVPALLLAGANLPVFDERLDAAASGIIESQSNWQSQDNAWRYLYGITAASDEPVLERAERVLNMMRDQANTKNYDATQLNALLDNSDADIEWLARYPALSCRIRDNRNCFAQLKSELANGELPERARTMLSRYEHLIDLSQFTEPDFMSFQSPLPRLNWAMDLSKLRMALASNEGEDAFVRALEQDFEFWRMALRESESLIGKMVANSVIHRNLLLLSGYLQSQGESLGSKQRERIAALIEPLSPDEVDISEAYRGELRGLASTQFFESWMGPSDIRELMASMAYQPNATVNDIYEYYIEPSMRLAKLNGSEFWQSLPINETAYPESRIFPPTIYNLSGKLMLSDSLQASADYIARMHNLQGMFRMLNIQLRAADDGIEELIESAQWSNPFTQEPFAFDSDKSELIFDCYKRNPDWCKITL